MRPLLILTLCCLPGLAQANAGVFAGSGQTVKLVGTDRIRMIKEAVRIELEVRDVVQDTLRGKGYVAKYDCRFQLRNLKSNPVSIQVGFPLNSQFFEPPYGPEEGRDLVEQYKFRAGTSRGAKYQTDWRPRDEENKFASIILWNMKFRPGETIDLVVEYEIPFSQALSTTGREWNRRPAKEWYSKLAGAFEMSFEYVTETGKSWFGRIDSASFRIDAKDLEHDLTRNGIYLGPVGPETRQLASLFQTLYCDVSPSGWKERNGVLVWEYANYSPGEPIRVRYFPSSIPSSRAHCKAVVSWALGETPSNEDLRDFREIVAAYYGELPQTERVKAFVENQWWFPAARRLGGNQKEVLGYMDSLVASTR